MNIEPKDADQRRAAPPVICYPATTLPDPGLDALAKLRETAALLNQWQVPPRTALCVEIAAGDFFRISCPQGSQVGDLNLWNANNLAEHFYSGKTRALHGSHLSTGDRLWSTFPHFRPLATLTSDSLAWYGIDGDGASVHDVIGTRCDPYTNRLLTGADYHNCCHSNLTRALAVETGMAVAKAEPLVHDVLNVFMCTGFSHDTGQYFMKSSPARTGDHLEFFAEIDVILGLSVCPGGDCGAEHSSDVAICHPLSIEVFRPKSVPDSRATMGPSPYDQSHGV